MAFRGVEYKWYNALMKAITKASRNNTALQVVRHMNNDMTKVKACKAVGMPCSSFYYITDNHPDALAEAQELIDASHLEQPGLIRLTKNLDVTQGD